MRSKLLFSMALLSLTTGSILTSSAVLAAASCKCTKQCMMKCHNGDGAQCTCKACDCAKSKTCDKNHCAAHEGEPVTK